MTRLNQQLAANTKEPARIRIGDYVHIIKRGTRGNWTADYSFVNACGVHQHSRRFLGTRNRQIAERKARELEVKITNGQFKQERQTPILTENAIALFIAAKEAEGASHKTIVKYRAELKTYGKFLKENGATTLQRITVRLDDQYRTHRMQVNKLDSYTLYAHTMIRKSWLRWCATRSLIEINPLAMMKVSRPRRKRYPAASLAQLNQILSSSSGYFLAVIAVLAFTGLRVGEVAALRLEDVDLESGVLHVRRRIAWSPKTASSERSVPLHRRLLAILRSVPKGKRGMFFNAPPSKRFPQGERAIDDGDINERFQKIAKQHGFVVGRKNVGLTTHSLRRTFKTCCYDAGVPKPMVDFWLGHADQNNMDLFYYDPQKSKEWIERVPFGEPNEKDLDAFNGDQNDNAN